MKLLLSLLLSFNFAFSAWNQFFKTGTINASYYDADNKIVNTTYSISEAGFYTVCGKSGGRYFLNNDSKTCKFSFVATCRDYLGTPDRASMEFYFDKDGNDEAISSAKNSLYLSILKDNYVSIRQNDYCIAGFSKARENTQSFSQNTVYLNSSSLDVAYYNIAGNREDATISMDFSGFYAHCGSSGGRYFLNNNDTCIFKYLGNCEEILGKKDGFTKMFYIDKTADNAEEVQAKKDSLTPLVVEGYDVDIRENDYCIAGYVKDPPEEPCEPVDNPFPPGTCGEKRRWTNIS